MAGGTSRADHSEVGSSYVHFNYTPDGDKTTASLFGDVSRGVMLDQPPIFLGGQGGAVGPVRVGYGTVVAAGSVLLDDVLEDGQLVAAVPPPGFKRDRRPRTYRSLARIVRNNVLYLANLTALEQWYRTVREPFFAGQELGPLVYEGALEMLSLARKERVKRLVAMAGKVPDVTPGGREFAERAESLCALFTGGSDVPADEKFVSAVRSTGGNYLETIQGLPPDVRRVGVEWLERIISSLCESADAVAGTMNLFDRQREVVLGEE
jgi:UDP-N-acetylglucosamine/UDP-N-acetylgalactosamine diphosphorylase